MYFNHLVKLGTFVKVEIRVHSELIKMVGYSIVLDKIGLLPLLLIIKGAL